jgi:large subunit ribosomal protein L17
MRHRVKGKKLGRTASHKKATMRSLSIALLTHHRIVTTLSKAKELRRYAEPLVNRAKEDTMHNRREVFSFLQDNSTVSKLFDEIGPKVGDRQGGYTRVIKMGTRVGDSAQMAVIELVDYNESEVSTTSRKRKRTRRAGKSVTKSEVSATTDATAQEVSSEAEIVETADTQVVDETIADDTAGEINEAEISDESSAGPGTAEDEIGDKKKEG